MDTLPQELVGMIVEYLDPESRRRALTMNLKFQAEVERISGVFKSSILTQENVEKFLDIYSGHRGPYLQTVQFVPTLPQLPLCPYRHPWRGNYKGPNVNRAECRKFDARFTRQIFFLFSTLKTLERCVGKTKMSPEFRLIIGLPPQNPPSWADLQYPVYYQRRLISWRIHLLSPEALPKLDSVRSLEFEFGWMKHDYKDKNAAHKARMIDFRVILDILAKLPKLQYLLFASDARNAINTPISDDLSYLNESTRTDETKLLLNALGDSRRQFLDTINTGIPFPKLVDVQWNFLSPDILSIAHYQKAQYPQVIESVSPDPFVTRLRMLSYPLRRMYLSAVIDKTLFSCSEGSVPHWPNLESIIIKFPIVSPSGSWYFRGLERADCKAGHRLGSDTSPGRQRAPLHRLAANWERDRFRIVPKYDVLGPVLLAFAKATEHMPSLTEAALWCPLHFDTRTLRIRGGIDPAIYGRDPWIVSHTKTTTWSWGIAYTKPGWKAFNKSPGEAFSNSRQIWWRIGPWDIDPEIREQIQQIGLQKHGDALIEHWGSTRHGAHLSSPKAFEKFERRIFE